MQLDMTPAFIPWTIRVVGKSGKSSGRAGRAACSTSQLRARALPVVLTDATLGEEDDGLS